METLSWFVYGIERKATFKTITIEEGKEKLMVKLCDDDYIHHSTHINKDFAVSVGRRVLENLKENNGWW